MDIWVPWRPGRTAREQRAIRNRRGRGGARADKNTTAAVIKKRRKALLNQLKKGKITPKEYRRELDRMRG